MLIRKPSFLLLVVITVSINLIEGEIATPCEANRNYLVTNKGRVYSLKRGKFLSTNPTRAIGYVRVSMGDGQYYVHRLVADAFLDKPEEEGLEVNHKDENKLNNCAENLE